MDLSVKNYVEYKVVEVDDKNGSQSTTLLDITEAWDQKPVNFLLSFLNSFNSY